MPGAKILVVMSISRIKTQLRNALRCQAFIMLVLGEAITMFTNPSLLQNQHLLLWALLAAVLLIVGFRELRAQISTVRTSSSYWTAENVMESAYTMIFCTAMLAAVAYCGFSYLSQMGHANISNAMQAAKDNQSVARRALAKQAMESQMRRQSQQLDESEDIAM